MTSVKVGRRGQITIPKDIRRTLQVKEGDRVAFVWKGGEIVLQPMRETLADHRGTVPVEEPQDFEDIRRQVVQDQAAKNARNDA